jgi:hypothetical protein
MREAQLVALDTFIVLQDEIEVQRPRAPTSRTFPMVPRFDAVQLGEKCRRRERGLQPGRCVEEEGRFRVASHRQGAIESARVNGMNIAVAFQLLQGALEMASTMFQTRAERDQRGIHETIFRERER